MKTFRKICSLSALFFTLAVFAATSTDMAILNTINAKIKANPVLSSANPVAVQSNEGNVTLVGKVDTDQQASALVEIAQSVDDVNDVNTDQLKVKDSKQPFADTVITAKVKGLLLQKKLFTEADVDAMGVKVETKNGTVYLAGKVDSKEKIRNAVEIAKSVKGVKSVESNITLSS